MNYIGELIPILCNANHKLVIIEINDNGTTYITYVTKYVFDIYQCTLKICKSQYDEDKVGLTKYSISESLIDRIRSNSNGLTEMIYLKGFTLRSLSKANDKFTYGRYPLSTFDAYVIGKSDINSSYLFNGFSSLSSRSAENDCRDYVCLFKLSSIKKCTFCHINMLNLTEWIEELYRVNVKNKPESTSENDYELTWRNRSEITSQSNDTTSLSTNSPNSSPPSITIQVEHSNEHDPAIEHEKSILFDTMMKHLEYISEYIASTSSQH